MLNFWTGLFLVIVRIVFSMFSFVNQYERKLSKINSIYLQHVSCLVFLLQINKKFINEHLIVLLTDGRASFVCGYEGNNIKSWSIFLVEPQF